MVEIVLRGPAKNALGTKLMAGVREALREAAGQPVLITGEGDAFSAGLDLKEVVSLDVEGMDRFLAQLGGLLSEVFHYPGPTVAAVNGHAIAGGCLLALACDHRVASTSPASRIGLNEVALGLRFPPGILDLVRYRVPGKSEVVTLGGGLYAPTDACAVGLIDEVAPDGLSVARARLASLAALPADAYADTKRALRGHVTVYGEADRAAQQRLLPHWTSDTLKQRILSFLKK